MGTAKQELNFTVRTGVTSHHDLGPTLVGQIHRVVQSAFGRPDFDLADTQRHLAGDHIMMGYLEGDMVAFSTLVFGSPADILKDPTLPATDGCYFAAGAVSREVQGNGAYRTMNQQRIGLAVVERGVPLVYTRTQNPIVETGITRGLRGFVQEGAIQDFSLERVLRPGHYGGMLTGEKPPKSPDPVIQAAYDLLDTEGGDAYILLFNLIR